ncbi:MAG TPA: HEAT repeat domain-containing protein [Thioploca sp.]|nr:MAG: hypothetical protein B6247_05450 [Beggiatoa sp. 4572_84]RKZ61408.1 MAG: hypothetical protein DRR08_08855 [Gammaproteobacteria bacterium]HDN26363.1 HEAT repeat domain-containing protein [Thioploca sp.]
MKRVFVIATFLVAIIVVAIAVFFWQAEKTEEPATLPAPPEKVVQSSQPPPKTLATPDSQQPAPKKSEQPTQKKVVKPIQLRFSPTNGNTLAYSFEGEAETQIDFWFLIAQVMPSDAAKSGGSQQRQKSEIKLKASGELYLKYYAYKPGRWNVAAIIRGLDYQINGQTATYAEAIQYPVAFRMNNKGYISHFKFVKDISPQAKQAVQNLIYMMQVGFAKEAKTTWRTREVDPTGTYRAEYILEQAEPTEPTIHLTKRKLKYLSIKAAQSGLGHAMADTNTRIEHSLHQITLPQKGSWLLSIKQQERTVSTTGSYEWATGNSRFSAHRIARSLSKQFPERFAQFLADLNSPRYIKPKYYATDERLNWIGANLDINGALAKYAEVKQSGIMNASSTAEKFFVNYLRQKPQAAFEVVGILDGDSKAERFDQSTHLTLWRLIIETGHTEAQQAVVQAATESHFSDLTHIRALLYVHDFEYPEAFMVEKLWELHQDMRNSEGLQQMLSDSVPSVDVQTIRERKTMSLYAIGSLGHQEKLNEELKPEIGKQLVANLKNTDDPKEQSLTLTAISNYGGADVLDEIAPYFTAEDSGVRASAYDALRRMDDPAAIAVLAQHYATEKSPKVRQAALQTLVRMPPTAEGIEWARKEALVVDFREGQEALVKVLGENLKEYPENEAVLRELLKQNPSNRVKQEIYEYVVPL